MKSKLLLLIVAGFLSNCICAQNLDFSTIHIYRSRAFIGLEYPVLFNNVKVHTIPMDSRTFFSYKIHSEGKLEIDVMNGYKINLDIENGKNYYINEWKFVPEAKGKTEFEKHAHRPDLYTKMEEDKNHPIIQNPQNNNFVSMALPLEEKKNILKSEVDINIPTTNHKDENRYALIIGNEDYSSFQNGLNSESNVDFAVNDAHTVQEYAKTTLGIPAENIIYHENARAIEMSRSIKILNTIIKNAKGKADIFVYYAGHGLPEETTNEPYLIPVDVSGNDLQFAVKLSYLYAQLSEFQTERVTVVLDACFSGGGRNQGLVSARGVKVNPKENVLKGNLVVFTASSGDQSSYSYKDKGHGLFTYYFLKKIQETQGDITYKALSEYLGEQVGIKSALINQKEQNPQTLLSDFAKDKWESWKIK